MTTEWEKIVALARELDRGALSGRGLDFARIRDLAAAALAFDRSTAASGSPRAPWKRVVQLAEEVERTGAARGQPDLDVAVLFVRSLVDFQAQLVGARPVIPLARDLDRAASKPR